MSRKRMKLYHPPRTRVPGQQRVEPWDYRNFSFGGQDVASKIEGEKTDADPDLSPLPIEDEDEF